MPRQNVKSGYRRARCFSHLAYHLNGIGFPPSFEIGDLQPIDPGHFRQGHLVKTPVIAPDTHRAFPGDHTLGILGRDKLFITTGNRRHGTVISAEVGQILSRQL